MKRDENQNVEYKESWHDKYLEDFVRLHSRRAWHKRPTDRVNFRVDKNGKGGCGFGTIACERVRPRPQAEGRTPFRRAYKYGILSPRAENDEGGTQ